MRLVWNLWFSGQMCLITGKGLEGSDERCCINGPEALAGRAGNEYRRGLIRRSWSKMGGCSGYKGPRELKG